MALSPTNYSKLSFRQVSVMMRILQDLSQKNDNFLRQRFIDFSMNYDETVAFLSELSLMRLAQGVWVVSEKLQNMIGVLDGSEAREGGLREFVLSELLNSDSVYGEEVYDYVSKFVPKEDGLSYTPSVKENQACSDVRNFLMELNVVEFVNDHYQIAEKYVATLSAFEKKPRKLSLEALKRIQAENEGLGRAAEEAVIEYERQRLKDYPDFSDRVRRISEENVRAGYDVESFNCEGSAKQIFIEVKAVSAVDLEFIWTVNEISAAQRYGDRYHLYLVPVVAGGTFNMSKLRIIRDPYHAVYDQEEKWSKTPLEFIIKEKIG